MSKKFFSNAIMTVMALLKISTSTAAFAQQNSDEARWQRAVDDGTVQAYVDFVLQNPTSRFVDEAICRIGTVNEPVAVEAAVTAAAGQGGTGTGATIDDCREYTSDIVISEGSDAGAEILIADYSIVLATDTRGRMFNV